VPRVLPVFILLAASALGVARESHAQSEFGTTAIVRASLLAARPAPSAALGGGVSRDLTDRLAVEGDLVYFTRGRWATAWTGTGALRIALGPFGWTDPAVPFVVAGGGVQRATIDLADPRLLGPIASSWTPGAVFCPDRGMGPGVGPGTGFGDGPCTADALGHWGVGELPDFYARRLGPLVVPADREWPDRSFVDPAVTFGGGLHLHVGRHLVLQPEVRVWTVIADGRTRTSALLGVTAGYGF
jgi:hypothetical protein